MCTQCLSKEMYHFSFSECAWLFPTHLCQYCLWTGFSNCLLCALLSNWGTQWTKQTWSLFSSHFQSGSREIRSSKFPCSFLTLECSVSISIASSPYTLWVYFKSWDSRKYINIFMLIVIHFHAYSTVKWKVKSLSCVWLFATHGL